MGLATDYSQDETIRSQCRQLMALSLIPIDEVDKQYQRLRAIASPALDDLFLYFHRQWLNGNVPARMWNFFDVNHRTNNTSEGMQKIFCLWLIFLFDIPVDSFFHFI